VRSVLVAGRLALGAAAALRVAAPDLGLVPCLGLVPWADARLVAAFGAWVASLSRTSAWAAERISRDLRRLTFRGCRTPCSEALSRAEVASFSSATVDPSSAPSITRRALVTAVRTEDRTRRLRSCLRAADRMRLRAELVFAMLSRLMGGTTDNPGQVGTDSGVGPAPQYSNRPALGRRLAGRVARMLRLGRAPAKLNLALELTARRADGYHELRAVSQTIDWSDVVALEQDEPSALPPAVPELQVWGPEAGRVPLGPANIALRAALLLRNQGLGQPITRLALEKRIPTQSGLGGGSADAAAVLRMAGVGLDPGQLEQLALECGADVPFGLCGGACLLSGIGQVMSPVSPLTTGAFLIVVLESVATAAAYAATRPSDFSDGSRVEQLAATLQAGFPPDPELFGSGLQPAAIRVVPALAERLQGLRAATPGVNWAMTGSGGAFFSYQPDGMAAASLARTAAPACPNATIRVALPLPDKAA